MSETIDDMGIDLTGPREFFAVVGGDANNLRIDELEGETAVVGTVAEMTKWASDMLRLAEFAERGVV